MEIPLWELPTVTNNGPLTRNGTCAALPTSFTSHSITAIYMARLRVGIRAILRLADTQPVSLGVEPLLGLMTRLFMF
jgi:hypothetical protein